MSKIEVVSRDADRLRFFAYNTCCEVALREPAQSPALWDQVLENVRRVQRMLDAYDEASELSALRAAPANRPIRLSDEFFSLLQTLLAACAASSGAFDITVGGLSRLWDFAGGKPRRPDTERLREALTHTGYGLVALNEAEKTVTMLRDGVCLDAGAAGKGYAVQRLTDTLRGMGVKNATINLGGNLYLLSGGPHDGCWSIGVQEPWERRGRTLGELRLKGDVAVSTSGGYDRFFIEDGHIWHHLLDPRTGCPVESSLLSCTVVCSDALMSDVLSTVLFIGGEACMRQVAQAVCPDAFAGCVMAYADGSVEISPELEDSFTPMWE